jgi:hypothetical protein
MTPRDFTRRWCGERIGAERPALTAPIGRNAFMPVRSSGLLAKQPIVVGMAADPEPDQPIRCFDRQGAIVSADTSRPEATYFFEVK